MRLFAVGDIHGCGTAFEVLLAAIDLGPKDKLVALGDYLNKGPETKLVFDQLIPLADKGIVIPLIGNHELKMMAARRIGQPQLENNVLIDQNTLHSYGSDDEEGRFEDIPEKHWRFVEDSCLNWFTTEDYIFVHATLDADKPLVKQPRSALFWDKFRHPRPHCSGKTVVCGHTPQRDGTPVNLGHAICLDTAACEGHWLTCLEMNSGEVWQTNQQRQVRRSNIRDYFFGNQASADGSAYEHQLSVAR
jgi:serine/threonine protein phosphatase 1